MAQCHYWNVNYITLQRFSVDTKFIGVGRFRILGGGGGGSHRRHVPTRFLINQCQIITFLFLKV